MKMETKTIETTSPIGFGKTITFMISHDKRHPLHEHVDAPDADAIGSMFLTVKFFKSSLNNNEHCYIRFAEYACIDKLEISYNNNRIASYTGDYLFMKNNMHDSDRIEIPVPWALLPIHMLNSPICITVRFASVRCVASKYMCELFNSAGVDVPEDSDFWNIFSATLTYEKCMLSDETKRAHYKEAESGIMKINMNAIVKACSQPSTAFDNTCVYPDSNSTTTEFNIFPSMPINKIYVLYRNEDESMDNFEFKKWDRLLIDEPDESVPFLEFMKPGRFFSAKTNQSYDETSRPKLVFEPTNNMVCLNGFRYARMDHAPKASITHPPAKHGDRIDVFFELNNFYVIKPANIWMLFV